MPKQQQTVATATRLLTMVRYLDAYPDTTLAELAQFLGTSEEQVEADIALLLQTGATMFPNDLVDIVRDEQYLSVASNAQFSQTLRLSLPEAIALAFGIENLLATPGQLDEHLAQQVLDKLSAASGRDFSALVQIGAGSDDYAAEIAIVDQALATHHRVEFRYASREKLSYSHREVFPYTTMLVDGEGYLIGVDASDSEDRYRNYRFDRMQDLKVSSKRTTLLRPPQEDFSTPFAFGSTKVHAKMRINREYGWLVHQQNFQILERDAAGNLTVSTPVVSRKWLRDFLIQNAAGVILLGPQELIDDMAEQFSTVLQAYGLD